MGFWGVVINRIPFNMKHGLKGSKGMEFIWKPTPDGPGLFTHVLHTHYSAPLGFDWEEPGGIPLNEGSIRGLASQFADECKKRSSAYRTDQLLVPFGDDFKFKAAEIQFGNMDRLIREINKQSGALGVRIQYSTLSEYFAAVSKEAQNGGLTFPVYTGDFFPYADNSESYWTGYYSTRPTLKGVIRMAESSVRAAEQLMVLARAYADGANTVSNRAGFDGHFFLSLQEARREVSLSQHHDAITGTSKAAVINDYSSRLEDAIRNADSVATAMQEYLLSHGTLKRSEAHPADSFELRVKELNDKPEFLQTENRTAVLLHNSLGWDRVEVVQLMVPSLKVAVYDPEGAPLGAAAQVRPQWQWDPQSGSLDGSATNFQVSFIARVPALGMATYFIETDPTNVSSLARPAKLVVYESCESNLMLERATKHQLKRSVTNTSYQMLDLDHPITLQTDHISLELDYNGFPQRLTSKKDQSTVVLSQGFFSYYTQQSGAYIFRANSPAMSLARSECVTVGVSIGAVTEDALVKGPSGIGLKVSLDRPKPHVDLDISITPPGANQELVSRFSTDIQNADGTFYADNGVNMVFRTPHSSIPASYAPLVHRACIEDSNRRLTVISSQAVGVGSLGTGQLEFMLHRNLAQDDGRGLGEALHDEHSANLMMRLLLNSDELDSIRQSHETNNLLVSSMREMRWPLSKSIAEFRTNVITRFAPLNTELPADLHLMTLATRDIATSTSVMQLVRIGTHEGQPSLIELELG